MRHYIRNFTLACLLLVLSYNNVAAHPHVWIEARSKIVFNDQQLISKIQHSWTFDEAFSVYVIQGLDENDDGHYTREELAPLAQINVESLAEFDFFTFMGKDEATVDFAPPEDYWLELNTESKLLTLHFSLPLTKAQAVKDQIILEVYDPEFFVDFAIKQQGDIALAGAIPANCSVEVKPAEQLDESMAVLLSELPADEREVPEEFYAVTSALSNSAIVSCS